MIRLNSDIWELDMNVAPEWQKKQGQLLTGRYNPKCLVFNDAVIIAGGNNLHGLDPSYEKLTVVERFVGPLS